MADLMDEDTHEQNPRSRGLGRGLSALLGETDAPEEGTSPATGRSVPIERLRPNRFQPRHHFDDAAISDLVTSIRENGIIQPILVRPVDGDGNQFEIVAGERRWRAAQKAQLHEVPIVVRTLTNSQALEVALVENIQREDLSSIEEAKGYQQLIDDFGHTQADIAAGVGKSRSHVANTLRLLGLPESVQRLLAEGKLSAGHARALITAKDPESLARQIVSEGLSVRQAENLAKAGTAEKPKKPSAIKPKDADTLALQEALSGRLGLKVAIDHASTRGGKLTVRYQTLEQLDELIARLSR